MNLRYLNMEADHRGRLAVSVPQYLFSVTLWSYIKFGYVHTFTEKYSLAWLYWNFDKLFLGGVTLMPVPGYTGYNLPFSCLKFYLQKKSTHGGIFKLYCLKKRLNNVWLQNWVTCSMKVCDNSRFYLKKTRKYK